MTAVEWLVEEIECRGIVTKELRLAFERAKEMEKNQIIESYRDGRSDQQSERPSRFYNRNSEQYYNETYNK